MYESELKEIRRRLRLSMNGAVSASMRAQGVDYKVNFGVLLAHLKELASLYVKDAGLAEALWQTDTRELKILATILYPPEQFTPERAEAWTAAVRHQEIAEQYCINLLQELSFALELAGRWIDAEEEYAAVVGYTLYARLFTKGGVFPPEKLPEEEAHFLQSARTALLGGISRRQRAALLALKRYGRQSGEQQAAVLNVLSDFQASGDAGKREFYSDLLFEFEYYQS